MAKDQAMSADRAVVANHDRWSRIDKRQLHDRTISSDNKSGIWKLESTDINLLINLGSLADFNVWRVQKRHRADLHKRPEPDLFPTDNREEPDRSVVSDFYVVPAKHRA